ncbi:hypothetical protein BO99DRAFT_428186 [Aspergillus violaceofuscus CBS 115571]|uniref:MACPF domain-containing protein n=1 Tax=Aspergillus violaceofuscus (strain CBS 115571) TaxID=1450538 RepID=A0A2V5HQP2_ASPV1|nr:hypothetical protein BO99DRAFT_428186 [Aspergillus violaceofuscus CBS 115571]
MSLLKDLTTGMAKGVVGTAKTTTDVVDDSLGKVQDSLDGKTTTQTSTAPESTPAVRDKNGETKVIKEKTVIPFTNVDKKGLKLSDIRNLLVSEKSLEPRLLWSPFINQRGAKVSDETTFKTYLRILNEKSSETGDSIEDNSDTYRVYLKSKRILETGIQNGLLDRGTIVELDKKLPQLPVAAQPKTPEVPTSFSHNIFLNPTTTFSIVHPSDMNEKQWSATLRSNSLLHAYRVVDEGGDKYVERSLYPTFVLKPRSFWNYQISATAEIDSIAEQKQLLRIPRFRIADDSYISQYEAKKSVARAIAQNSLSETSAEMAISGGAFGYSASASASWGQTKSSSSTSSTKQDSRVMTITYNFPRVVIDFEPAGLDLSEEAKADLQAVDSAEAVDIFKAKYGRFFATRVQLGGRLHASEESTSTDAASTAAQAKSMRAAAALSFSSPWVQASASVSHSNASSSSSESKDSSSISTISWEAQGGDTLQSNNPPAWAYTVGSYYNWRPIKQNKIVALEDLISKLPGYQNTKERFAALLAARDNAAQGDTSTPSVSSDKTISFTLVDREGKVLSLPAAPTEGNSYDQNLKTLQTLINDNKAGDVLTAERLKFLGDLSSQLNQSVPLQFDKEGTVGAAQVFTITTNDLGSTGKLRFNTPYRIRVEPDTDDNTAPYSVGVNPTLSGYFCAPTMMDYDTRELMEGDTFMLLLYGKEKNALGLASRYRPLEYLDDEDEDDNNDSKSVAYKLGTDVDRGGSSPIDSHFYLKYV